MSVYTEFVKAQMGKLPKDMKQTDKMKAIGKLWQEQKASPNKRGRKVKHTSVDASGSGLLDDVVGGLKGAFNVAKLVGLGLDKKKKGKKQSVNEVKNQIIQDVLAKPKRGSRKGKKEVGSGFFDDAWDGLSTGFALPFKALATFA